MKNYLAYWDWFTYALYMIIGIIVILLVIHAEKDAIMVNNKKHYLKKSRYYYLIAFLILMLFAATRLVTKNIGGADAWNYYVNDFLHPKDLHINILDVITLNKGEPLFNLFVKLIRTFTDNYHIYFVFVYSLISYSFLKFASKNYTGKGFFIVYFLFMILYLNSFSGIRWYLCMAFALIAICFMQDKRYKLSFLFSIICFLFHYTGLIIIAFQIFVIVMQKVIEPKLKNDKQYILFIILCFLLILACIPILRCILLNTKYDAYLRKGFSFLGYIPIFVLFFFIIYFIKDIKQRDLGKLNLYGCFFNIIITPIVMFCGAYRFDYFFMPARLIIWSYIAKLLFERFDQKFHSRYLRIAMYFCMFSGIVVWFTFRMYQMHISNSLMPYINIFWI
ncbi:MAG: EpsG family protein [Erysipelotrichaceae bacterium]|nr:EpsG family protein [Erysipelotrichaceae bacterium]